MLKKYFLFTVIISTLFFAFEAKAMWQDPDEETPKTSEPSPQPKAQPRPQVDLSAVDVEKQYFVHLSSIMSENSTKIAGAALSRTSFDGNDFTTSGMKVESRQENIRRRITLHHCFGAPVPDSDHGPEVNTLWGPHKPTSYLYSNTTTLCAYLDLVSSFKGEIIGGNWRDMFTVDRHVYGNTSIILVPEDLKCAFTEKNPGYKGKLITFDPKRITIHDKIREVIEENSSEISGRDIGKMLSKNPLGTYKLIQGVFEDQNWLLCDHNPSYYGLLEALLYPFHSQVQLARLGKTTLFLAVDQVEPRIEIIRALLDLILHDAKGRLSEGKYQEMKTWAEEIEVWMDLFLFDRDLRWKRHKSVFYGNKNFGEFISARQAGRETAQFVESLTCEEDYDLKLVSDSLFPELLNRSILGSQANVGMEKVIKEVTEDSLSALRQLLLKSKAAQHLDGIALLCRLQRLLKAPDFERDHLVELTQQGLDEMPFSPKLQSHVTALIEALIDQDTSYKNSGALAVLNSRLGKTLQQKIWGASKTLTFHDLLQRHSKTKLLFEREALNPSEVNFVNRVVNWSLNRAVSGEINVPHSTQVSVHTGISVPSLFNVSQIYWSIVSPVEDYRLLLASQDLNRPLDPKNPLNKLIKEGCFTSWLDIVSSCLPLHQLNALDIEHLNFFFSTMDIYYAEIQRYLKKKTDFLNLQEELAQKAAQEHNKYLEMAERDDLKRSEYAELLGYFCHTFTKDLPYLAICWDVVTGDSPLDAIKALEIYEKALRKHPEDKWIKLHIKSVVTGRLGSVDNLKKFAKLQSEKALVVPIH